MKIDFSDTQTAFRSKSNQSLQQSQFLFRLLASPLLVNSGKTLTKIALNLHLPVKGIIKSTVYRQFVGGETMEECLPAIQYLLENNVHAILDYSVEGKQDESDFDRTCDTIIRTLEFASQHRGLPFGVFKPTGIVRFALLEKMHEKQPLDAAEEKEWEAARARFYRIADAAKKYGVPVMIDAEESWIQDPVDAMAEELMAEYNKERIIVCTTLQMYRWDRLGYLEHLIEKAREGKFLAGIKIVRGAYMEKENARAIKNGYPSPIQPTKMASDRDYDMALSVIVQNLDICLLVAGTHNEDSAQHLINLLIEKNLAPDDKRIWFSQLFGMSDHISFMLSQNGYNVVKYLPFGPVHEVMPYLFRRAEENTSVSGQTNRELSLIQKELRRREI